MPTLIRAEYLSYYNPSRNSDKLFNVFLVRSDNGTYSCLTENGRRGSNLVRRVVCEEARRETAEQRFWEKVRGKRNHSDTPYQNETFGKSYSQIASLYATSSEPIDVAISTERKITETKSKVIDFPVEKSDVKAKKQKQNGILNIEQFDSLEF